eukprot:6190921-Pleurochrysis_carterae.AAC.1
MAAGASPSSLLSAAVEAAGRCGQKGGTFEDICLRAVTGRAAPAGEPPALPKDARVCTFLFEHLRHHPQLSWYSGSDEGHGAALGRNALSAMDAERIPKLRVVASLRVRLWVLGMDKTG